MTDYFGHVAGIALESSRIWTSLEYFSWRCAVDYHPDWSGPDFDDSQWPRAAKSNMVLIHYEYQPGLGTQSDQILPGEPPAGAWIWASQVKAGQTIYCRGKLGQ